MIVFRMTSSDFFLENKARDEENRRDQKVVFLVD